MRSQCKLVLGLALLGLLGGCGKSNEAPPAQQAVEPARGTPIASSSIAVAEIRTLRPKFEVPAITEALQSAEIRPEVQAIIKAIDFSVGDLVEKGDVLVELEPSKFEAQTDAAEAGLQSAQANLEQAENNWARAQKLKPQGYISDLDSDQAKSGVGTARASVARAEAELELARHNLSRTTITAPFNGKISRPYHAVGDLVGPLAGQPLFQLVQLDPIYAVASIELSKYNEFVALRSKLSKEGVEVPDLEVYLELAGGQDYEYQGEFAAWSQAGKGSQGTISARVIFPNPEGLLLPGQNVMIRGEAAVKVDRVIIPQRAVQQDQQGYYVKVIDAENTVQRKNIQVGTRDGTDWSVLLGLEAGERVIVEGGASYKPGTVVDIVDQPQ
jgi:membrane fusion protein (multidrug efflux system)